MPLPSCSILAGTKCRERARSNLNIENVTDQDNFDVAAVIANRALHNLIYSIIIVSSRNARGQVGVDLGKENY